MVKATMPKKPVSFNDLLSRAGGKKPVLVGNLLSQNESLRRSTLHGMNNMTCPSCKRLVIHIHVSGNGFVAFVCKCKRKCAAKKAAEAAEEAEAAEAAEAAAEQFDLTDFGMDDLLC